MSLRDEDKDKATDGLTVLVSSVIVCSGLAFIAAGIGLNGKLSTGIALLAFLPVVAFFSWVIRK